MKLYQKNLFYCNLSLKLMLHDNKYQIIILGLIFSKSAISFE